MKQRLGWLLLLAACVLHAGAGTPVAAQETEALGDDYVAGDFGRLLYQENGVTVRRTSADKDPSVERVAGVNAPIFPGDGVSTAFDQRAEIQLAGGSLVRIDRATDMTFLALPDPYAEIADNTVLQVEQGVVRINALLTSDSEFRIDTATASVFLVDDSDVRIAVDEDGTTFVASHRGVAQVAVGDRSVLLRSGTKTVVYPGADPEPAVAFNTLRGDRFDRWVAKRDAEWNDAERYAGDYEAYDEVPDEVRPYYGELSRNGRWVNSDDYGWVWYPGSVGSDWRPYSDGYWSYGSRGYFWVSHEPWGWAPYHYGRWGYYGGAWCWIPGRVFGGAWVAWSWGSAYIGWSPLGYWNTAYCGTPWGYSYGYYGPHWSFIGYNHFHYRSYRRHYVHYDHIDRRYLSDRAVVTRPPRVSPRALARSADVRDRAVRQARADRVAHLRPVDQEQRGARNNLRGAERRLTAERGARVAAAKDRARAGADNRGRGAGRPSPVAADRDRGTRGSGNPRADGVQARGLREKDGSTGGVAHRGGKVRPDVADRSTNARGTHARTTQGTRGATPRADRSDEPRKRMRDVYESMASPRSTRGSRPQATTPRSGSASGRSQGNRPKATTPRSGSSSNRPKATTPRGGSSNRPKATTPRRGSSSSRPKATTPRSGSSNRPKASPNRGSRPSRPKAAPKRDDSRSRPSFNSSRSSSSNRSRATTGRNSSPSRPRATTSRSSSPSRPRANTNRNSSPSRPKASPSRRSAPSRPKASPSRSSSGSRPKASPSRSRSSSRPKASRSSGRSSGSRPKASSSRGRSSGSKSRSRGN